MYIKSVPSKGGTIKLETGNIVLKAQLMGEVMVTGNRLSALKGFAGGLSVRSRYTRYEKVKIKCKEVLGINEINVYPNPVSAKSSFNLGFNLKEPGTYTVQFTDVSGKIIFKQQLNIVSKVQRESFNGNIFHGSGIYFVSVTGRQYRKIYSAKLLVQ